MQGMGQNVFNHQGLPWLDDLENAGNYKIVDNLADAKNEKLYIYDLSYVPFELANLTPANFQARNADHRLAVVYSHDENGRPIQGTFFGYNAEGFMKEKMTVFSNDSN